MIETIDFGEGKIVFKSFFVEAGIPLKEQFIYLYEDMLTVEYLQGKYVLDVGWYGSGANASFILRIEGEWREALLEERSYSLEELKESIEKGVKFIHQIMDQPDGISSYKSSVPIASIEEPHSVDQLLGKVEVEWEQKKSNVTSEMIQQIEDLWQIQLPNELRKIILNGNGGGPIPFYFEYNGENSIHFQRLFSFHRNDSLSIYQYKEYFPHSLPSKVVPIGAVGAAPVLCLDYRENRNQPAVIMCRVTSTVFKEFHIAHSFEEFLSKLYFPLYWIGGIQEKSLMELKANLDLLEQKWKIQLPHHYKKIVLEHHGALPEQKYFYYEKGRGEIEYFLRVDHFELEESVLTVYEKYFANTSYYPFAQCKNSQILCHDYSEKQPSVVLWDSKQQEFYQVKTSFSRFLQYLSY